MPSPPFHSLTFGLRFRLDQARATRPSPTFCTNTRGSAPTPASRKRDYRRELSRGLSYLPSDFGTLLSAAIHALLPSRDPAVSRLWLLSSSIARTIPPLYNESSLACHWKPLPFRSSPLLSTRCHPSLLRDSRTRARASRGMPGCTTCSDVTMRPLQVHLSSRALYQDRLFRGWRD